MQKIIHVPLIHIAEATATTIKRKKLDTVTLFGTCYTMNKPFYKDKLKNEFGINVIIPEKEEQRIINSIIYNELCKGIINETSKEKLNDIIKNANIQIINTTEAHCMEIVERII